jgi:hypothetical protein
MLFLETLPNEILLYIGELLSAEARWKYQDDIVRSDLSTLSLCSQGLRRIAKPLLFDSCAVELLYPHRGNEDHEVASQYVDRSISRLQFYSSNPDIATSTRYFTLDVSSHRENVAENYHRLQGRLESAALEAFSKFSCLQHLKFDGLAFTNDWFKAISTQNPYSSLAIGEQCNVPEGTSTHDRIPAEVVQLRGRGRATLFSVILTQQLRGIALPVRTFVHFARALKDDKAVAAGITSITITGKERFRSLVHQPLRSLRSVQRKPDDEPPPFLRDAMPLFRSLDSLAIYFDGSNAHWAGEGSKFDSETTPSSLRTVRCGRLQLPLFSSLRSIQHLDLTAHALPAGTLLQDIQTYKSFFSHLIYVRFSVDQHELTPEFFDELRLTCPNLQELTFHDCRACRCRLCAHSNGKSTVWRLPVSVHLHCLTTRSLTK